MKKKLVKVALSLVVVGAVLAGCGSQTDETNVITATESSAQEDSSDNSDTSDTTESIVVTVAASSTPHAEILKQATPLLEERGYTLKVTEFSDYVIPNNVVESGEIDVNYFQHIPYLDSFNEEHGTHLVSVAGIHYEPFGIYPGTESDLANLSEGANIAVPNDTTNEARALLLLEANGIITLKEGAGLTATILDIEENPYNVKIIEMEAAQIARVKDEMSVVVLNGNYALQAGLSVGSDAIAYETADSEGAKTYVNILVVKEGNENHEGVLALAEVLKSDEIVAYINETYDGAVIPFVD
ncbi:MAG: MetQ/NlpA family ABC transporter substrate-binding protein [Eubacteriales bacterium]